MKNLQMHLIILLLVAMSFTGVSGEKALKVRVTNPSDFDRLNEIISLPWGDVKKAFPSVNPASVLVLDVQTKERLVIQVAENELLFASDFKAKETRNFSIRVDAKNRRSFPSVVDGQFVEPRQDYAWENDRIAFRMYGPALAKEVDNGIDVWTKRVRYPIVQKWYQGEADTGAAKRSYHTDHGEGADFFSVGRSLGAGGSGIFLDGKIFQPGVFASAKTIANGPLRIAFELQYKWIVSGKQLKEVKRISLDAGSNMNRIEVSFTGEDAGSTMQIACGLVRRKNITTHHETTAAWLSMWGPTNDDTTNGELGTGIVLRGPQFNGIASDSLQHFLVGEYDGVQPFIYYAGAGWTRSGDFASLEDWNSYLDKFARRLTSPMKISLERK